MSLIGLIVVLAVVGVVLWLVSSYIPMQPTIKKILNVVVIIDVVVIIAAVLWLLSIFGVIGSGGIFRIGR